MTPLFDNKPEKWEIESINVQAYIGGYRRLKALTWENYDSSPRRRAPTRRTPGGLPVTLRVLTIVKGITDLEKP